MKARLPSWFKQAMPNPCAVLELNDLIKDLNLHTICDSAMCPNQGECYSKGTATFLILGDVCTRNCTFCAVKKGAPLPVDEDEPSHLVEAVERMGLKYVVITSVTRDDLPDGGAAHFARIVTMLKEHDEKLTIEVLVPDFQGDHNALKVVVDACPDVINHNVETVPLLYPAVRPMAVFMRSVELLRRSKECDPSILTKSGIMVGLGESEEELRKAMLELRKAGCDLLTVGQYLQPSPRHHPVIRYVPPEEFESYAQIAKELGFVGVASAPLVRSSFHALELFNRAKVDGRLRA